MRTTNRNVSSTDATRGALTKAHRQLVHSVEALVSGEDWRRMLDVSRRFQHYSPSNVLLILAQCRDATRVAGYETWRQLGRQVRAGERGITILAPCLHQPTPTEQTRDSLDVDAARRLGGFRVVHVFDLSQTTGRPLDDVVPVAVAGEAPARLWDLLAAHLATTGFRLLRGDCSPANGTTDHLARMVVVRPDLPPAQEVRTLAHEVAHTRLHDGTEYERGLRHVVEIEAESVAYLLCATAGLETDSYSFPYVAHWADGDVGAVRRTADRVITVARELAAAIDLGARPSSTVGLVPEESERR